MLTDLQCRKAKAGEKDYKLSDAHGLYLFVTKTGFRSWRWKYRFAGKEKRLVLGSYPDMTLNAARKAAGLFGASSSTVKNDWRRTSDQRPPIASVSDKSLFCQ